MFFMTVISIIEVGLVFVIFWLVKIKNFLIFIYTRLCLFLFNIQMHPIKRLLFNFLIFLFYWIILGIFSDPVFFSSIEINNINEFNLNNMRLPSELFNIRNINLSIGEQLGGVIDNLGKYQAEKIKFSNIIDNINNGTELFYPPESKSLFIQSLDLLDCLIEDLRSRELNLISNLPSLPEPTEEEIVSLGYFYGVLLPESSYQYDASFPVQTDFSSAMSDEKSYFEPEDYMNDVIGMGMFDEKQLTSEDYMNDFISLGMFDEN